MVTADEARRELARRELARRRGQAPQGAADKPSAAGDAFSSFAAGVGRGAADLVGLPGTIGDLTRSGLQWGLQKGYGLATGEAPDPRSESGVERFFAGPSPEVEAAMINGGQSPLGGEALRGGLSRLTDGATDYQPQTTAGKYARTAGEFLPGAMTLGGGGLLNAVRYGLIPAVTSEGAGQLTEDTALEPYARVAGALVGGAIGNRIGRPQAAKMPTAQQIKESAGYKDLKPLMQEARVNQSGYQRAVNELRAAADDFGMVPEQHAAFERILARHSEAASQGGATLQDLEILRRSLLNAGQQPTNPSAGALSRRLIEKLDSFVDEGAGMTGQALKEARQVYRTGVKAATVEEAIARAQNTASGFENGLRVEFRKLLNNKKLAGQWTDIERKAIEEVVRGNFTSNALRWLGGFGVPIDNGRNFLGSIMGGGAGAAIGSAVGGPVGAAIGGPLLVGAGTAAKAGANAATRNSASVAEALVKAGPQGLEMFGDALLANQEAGREAVLRALLQSQSAAQVPYAREYAR